MTAYGTVETAVAAMKDGAYDFLTKPLKRHALVKTVREGARAARRSSPRTGALKARLAELGARRGGLVGDVPGVPRLPRHPPAGGAVHAPRCSSLGESRAPARSSSPGALHELSRRGRRPVRRGQLRGHPRDAPRGGAVRPREGRLHRRLGAHGQGRFERAHGGTLFLDEIGEMPPAAQVKLLRVLQERRDRARWAGPRPSGSTCASSPPPTRTSPREVAEGRFREDLFYRLNVVAIRLPPLSWRREDIPLLAEHFLRRFAAKNAKRVRGFTPEALAALERLRLAGQRARAGARRRARGGPLPRRGARRRRPARTTVRKGPRGRGRATWSSPSAPRWRRSSGACSTRRCATPAGDKTMAAQLLGIATRTIYRKLERDGPRREDDATGVLAPHRGVLTAAAGRSWLAVRRCPCPLPQARRR